MPQRSFRPCSNPGCSTLTRHGRCGRHRDQQQAEARARDFERGSSSERGYDRRWRKARDAWLREHPLCGDRDGGQSREHSACAREGRVTAAAVVDHVVPHRGDDARFWDRGNWQALCRACHDLKTSAERSAIRAGVPALAGG